MFLVATSVYSHIKGQRLSQSVGCMRIRPAKPSSIWKWLITCGRAFHFCISPISHWNSLQINNVLVIVPPVGDKATISLACLHSWLEFNFAGMPGLNSLWTTDAFPVVASLPPKNSYFSGGREATTGNASAVRRLGFKYLWCFSSQKVVSGRITIRLKQSTAKYMVVQNCHPEKVTNKANLNNTSLWFFLQ